MDSPVRILAVGVAAALAVLTTATTASAVDQTPKNGCQSPVEYRGTFTSPSFATAINGNPQISGQWWFEVESQLPSDHDLATVELGVPPFGEADWTTLGDLNPDTDPGGTDDQGFSNNGLGQAPTFVPFSFPLPSQAPNVRVRFVFDTVDSLFQGFRGFGVDSILINTGQGFISQNFESGAFDPWVADTAPAGDPFWQVLTDPQNVSVKSPEVNPDLVTLPDSGALPAPPGAENRRVAWFGNTASGTFCGPDFANRFQLPDVTPPDTPITSGPPAFGTDRTPTFTFTSTEAGSTFQCSLDGGPFVACTSPFTTPRLSGGSHTLTVRAIDASGNVDPTPTVYTFDIARQLSELDPPVLGQEVNVGPVPGSGPVFIAVRGQGSAARRGRAGASQKGLNFVPLTEARQVPVGSFLNTRRGTVQLVSATGSRNRTQSGRFSQGLFQVLQSRALGLKGLTDIRLKGGNFNRCRTGRRGRAGAAQVSRRTIRRTRSSTNGRYRTIARNSAGTTRGTVWITADRCDGTLTTVKRGKVAVRDFRRKKTIIVSAGKRYLAKAPR